jgi:hypothetical protein
VLGGRENSLAIPPPPTPATADEDEACVIAGIQASGLQCKV